MGLLIPFLLVRKIYARPTPGDELRVKACRVTPPRALIAYSTSNRDKMTLFLIYLSLV